MNYSIIDIGTYISHAAVAPNSEFFREANSKIVNPPIYNMTIKIHSIIYVYNTTWFNFDNPLTATLYRTRTPLKIKKTNLNRLKGEGDRFT